MTLHTLLTVAAAAVALYLGFGVLYRFGFALAGLLPSPRPAGRERGRERARFAVLVTAYQADAAVVETARRALRQRYASDSFEVVVLADRLRPATLRELATLERVRTVLLMDEAPTRARAIRAGLRSLERDGFTGAVVLDADTHMAPDFLARVDDYFAAGFRAVQGQYTRLHAVAAHWDVAAAAAERHVFCDGHHALGLSARLSGTGMAFDFDLLRAVLRGREDMVDVHRELALSLTRLGESVAYAPEARAYGERLETEATSSLRGVRFLASAAERLLRPGSADHFDLALQSLLPAASPLPALALASATLCLAWSPGWAAVFAGLFLVNVAGFALAIPPALWEGASWLLVRSLPAWLWAAGRGAVGVPAFAKTGGRGAEVAAILDKSGAVRERKAQL